MIFFKRFHLFIFRGRGRGGEREGERHPCMAASCHLPPYWGPGPQPRHVPWLGIELVTLWFSGQNSIHWATPARALLKFIFFPFASRTHKNTKHINSFFFFFQSCTIWFLSHILYVQQYPCSNWLIILIVVYMLSNIQFLPRFQYFSLSYFITFNF